MEKTRPKKQKADRSGDWRQFWGFFRKVKLSWLWILLSLVISVAYYYVVTKIPGSTAALYSGEFTTAAIMGLVINYAGTLVLSLAVFGVFQYFVFGRLVKKHTRRITGYEEERQFFLKFFDGKAFAIMAFMMTFGILLRTSGLGPERFIAVFYSGLGASLLLAGVLFGRNYVRALRT